MSLPEARGFGEPSRGPGPPTPISEEPIPAFTRHSSVIMREGVLWGGNGEGGLGEGEGEEGLGEGGGE